MIKIAADLQGADRPQTELAAGVIQAAEQLPELYVYACGNAAELSPILGGRERIELVDAPEVITNSDDPALAFKEKHGFSLIRAMELCKSDSGIGGLVSCGPTGAIFVSAIRLLGRIARVSPMLAVELKKTDNSPLCVVDCGANVECRPEKLVDFARMGRAYMRALGISDPKTALLSNGAEDKKGTELIKAANALLRSSSLNFIGNTEGSSVLSGDADVIVCDGFSGNILLKTIEGAGKSVIAELRAMGVTDSALDTVYKKYDHNTQGGAVLLGTRIPVVKGHGAATAETVCNIIRCAYRLAANGLSRKTAEEFDRQGEIGCDSIPRNS